jgi:radical SAM protein with 4Fe4S-binding SPASM domain
MIAKALLDGRPEEAIVERLQRHFDGVDEQRARTDVARVRGIVDTLNTPGDNYPIVNLFDPGLMSSPTPLEKPLSADLTLAEPERLVPMLDRLWELGIPHVTLDAGSEPKADWLVRAVEHAEDLGLIAGVRACGTELSGGRLIEDLAAAGADHANVLLLSASAEMHDSLTRPGDHASALDALKRTAEAEVCPMAEIALVRPTLDALDDTVRFLAEQNLHNVGVFALATDNDEAPGDALRADELVQAAQLVEELAEELDVRCLWYAPTRCDPGGSLAEQIIRGARTSGDLAVRVEADGAVLPGRGPRNSGGNLLEDTWEMIHNSSAFRAYRQRVEHETHCDECPGLAICAADCPRNPEGWATEA